MTSGNNRKEGPDRAKSARVDTNFTEGTVPNALTLERMSPQLVKVAEHRESYLRRSRMVEISKSGSGEGFGWVTGRSYSTWVSLAGREVGGQG